MGGRAGRPRDDGPRGVPLWYRWAARADRRRRWDRERYPSEVRRPPSIPVSNLGARHLSVPSSIRFRGGGGRGAVSRHLEHDTLCCGPLAPAFVRRFGATVYDLRACARVARAVPDANARRCGSTSVSRGSRPSEYVGPGSAVRVQRRYVPRNRPAGRAFHG